MRTLRVNRSIDKPGDLIVTCGLSGSGKSTLVRHALAELNGRLNYLNTITTRAQRDNEDTLEYTFVGLQEYKVRKAQSKLWDESFVYENYYGVDAQTYIDRMDDGQNFIVCSVPSNDVIDEMRAIYSRERIITIHIPTSQSIAKERMRQRDAMINLARVAIDATISEQEFDAYYTLSLNGSVDNDRETFVNIIREIIA